MTPPLPSARFPEDTPRNPALGWLPTREDLSLILEASGNALFVTDAVGHILSLNPVAQRLIGRNQEVKGRTIHDLFGCAVAQPDAAQGCPLDIAVRSGEVMMLAEHRWTRADGVVLELTATYWPRRKGMEIIGTVVALQDLTAQWETQRDINRVAHLAENAPSPIVEFDDSGMMLYANTATVELMNTIGNRQSPVESIMPPQLDTIIRACLETKQPSPRYEHAVGQRVLSWSFFPMEDLRQVRAYGIDITANVELRKAKEAAEEAARAKSIFLATMSHELRTPMNGVLGCTQLLQETTLTEHQQELIVTMQRSAEMLLALVNDILDFSKIEADKMILEIADVDLRSLVRDVVTLVAELARKKGLALTCTIAENVPSHFRGDPVRLRQVLFNLVGNAIKFTEHGSVQISVDLESSSRPNTDIVTIRWTIKDTGIGMGKEQRERLFEAYVQADASTARRFGGTGLGLMISRQLVGMMGGTISVESAPERGSTFTYTTNLLPAIVRATIGSQEASSAAQASESRGPCRVLVADDNEINQVVACKFLQKLGYEVEVVPSGEEAVEALARANYDAMLIDCEMPDMDGYEATRCIRRGETTQSRRLPIIAMTGNTSVTDAQRCKDAGMDDVITKPVTLTTLRTTLNRLLRTQSS